MSRTNDVWLVSLTVVFCCAAYLSNYHPDIDFVGNVFWGQFQR